MPNVERDHDKESTHYACAQFLKEQGTKAGCCGCKGHDCQLGEPKEPMDPLTKFFTLPEKEQKETIVKAAEKANEEQRKVMDKKGWWEDSSFWHDPGTGEKEANIPKIIAEAERRMIEKIINIANDLEREENICGL